MDVFVVAAGGAAVCVVAFRVLHGIADGHTQAFASYFAGFRPDPWPVGVQEEYLERRWGSGTPSAQTPSVPGGRPYATVEEHPRAVAVERVNVHVRTRT